MNTAPISLPKKFLKTLYGNPLRVLGSRFQVHPEVDTFQIIRKAWDEGKTNCDSKVFT